MKTHVPPGCKDAYKDFLASILKSDLNDSYFENYLFDDAVPVDGIRLNRKNIELNPGDSIRVHGITSPETCNPLFLYQSTNSLVASVGLGGVVKAGMPGEADIICAFMEYRDTCHVVVNGSTEDRIILNESIKKVLLGNTITLKPTSVNGTTDFVAGVNHPDVVEASVSDGIVTVTGLKLGEADVTIWPADGMGKSATCHVTVINSVNNDVNSDGEVNVADVSSIYRIALGVDEDNGRADINLDGVVNASDISALYMVLLDNR